MSAVETPWERHFQITANKLEFSLWIFFCRSLRCSTSVGKHLKLRLFSHPPPILIRFYVNLNELLLKILPNTKNSLIKILFYCKVYLKNFAKNRYIWNKKNNIFSATKSNKNVNRVAKFCHKYFKINKTKLLKFTNYLIN